jgi:hypothetical protein
MEIADIMELAKTGRQHTLSAELERVGAEISSICGAWAQNIDLKLYNCEEALKINPTVSQWIQFAQDASLGSHVVRPGEVCPPIRPGRRTINK